MKMKKLYVLLLITFLIFPCCTFKKFGCPVEGEGWYYIKVRYFNSSELDKGLWKVTKVSVDGLKARDFLLYQDRKEVFDQKIRGELPFEIKVRCNWEGDKEYDIKIEFENTETGKFSSLQKKLKSPPLKGYWDSRWKNYLSLLISEENGYQRINYPVHATVGIMSKYIHSPDEIRVVKSEVKRKDVFYTEIPHQVYDVIHWKDSELLSIEEKDEETGMAITRYHPTTTLSIAFQTDLRPYEKATYLVFYNNPEATKPSYATDLQVKGKGLAKMIENSFYRVVLHEKSGMIHEIHEKETGTKLEHKLETNGAIHWNPGVYSPPHTWSHCSDWENPSYSEEIGPVFYSLRRRAPLPHLKDVMASISYYFYKDSPFIIMESSMEIKRNLFVKALRNGEIVFNKEIFDKAAYQTLRKQVKVIDFAHTKLHPEHVITHRPDTPWIAFFNEEKNIALASLFLELSTSNLDGGPASKQQPYIYIQHGPWYYLSRAFVYSFGSNNQSRMLPVRKGSLYYEKTAWIPFSFKYKGDFTHINNYYKMLKYPLSVREEIETYPESPEGWLVPILTEPFDEGVEKSIGGKKKK